MRCVEEKGESKEEIVQKEKEKEKKQEKLKNDRGGGFTPPSPQV